MTLIAEWASKGGKWQAKLYRTTTGYRLSERKHGVEVGASFRPFGELPNDEMAIGYYARYVATGFDVEMQRILGI